VPLTIHILDQTDRGAIITQGFIDACGIVDIRVEHIQDDCKTQPGCDLALVHGNDRAELRGWCDKAKLVVLYTGGNPRADADEYWIQRPLGKADDLFKEEYQSLVAFARGQGQVPDILRGDKAQLIQERRDRLIRLLVLGWICKDKSRATRLSANDRDKLMEGWPDIQLTEAKTDQSNLTKSLDALRKTASLSSPLEMTEFTKAAETLYQTVRRLLGEPA